MMNLLQISLTTRCNFECAYCPITQWRNVAPRKSLCNAELIPFLDRAIKNPEIWVVELTGGEPSLYEGINELLEWLSSHGFRTLVKTNGTGNLPHLPNVTIVAAFHKLEQPPKNFDKYLIINTDGRAEKEEYCKAHGIDYRVIGFNQDNFDKSTHGFRLCAFINPAGHQIPCQAKRAAEHIVDGVDIARIDRKDILTAMECCPACKAAIDAWKFL